MTWNPTSPLPAAFKEVPRLIYADDPHWIPEAADTLNALFSEQHDFFRTGRATVHVVDGAARLAGFYQPNCSIAGEPVAFFGFWETVDDLDVNRRLFEQVEGWAHRQGAVRLYGPVNFSTYGPYRIRLSAPPGAGCFPGEPYNPPYYARLLENLGYHLAARYISQASSRPYPDVVAQIAAAKSGPAAPLPDPTYRISPLTADFWMQHLRQLYPLVDTVFQENFAYTRISYEAFAAACGAPFARRLCPHTSLVAHCSDEIAGFFLAFPDYAPLVRQGNPNRIPLQDVRYEVHFPLLDRPVFLAKTLGVHPRHRRQGLLNLMATESVQRSLSRYSDGMICLMKVDNPSARFGLPFADLIREYGLYARAL